MEMYTLELYHHGTKNMKWGQRLYQNKDGSLTALGRIRYRKMQRERAKGDEADNAKKTSVKNTEAETADKKEKILASRSAKELYTNADLFTTDELNKAYQRLDLEKRIKNLAPEDKSKGAAFVEKVTKAGNRAKDLTSMGIGLYDNIAKIRNAFADSDDPWPLISSGNKKKDKNKKKNNQESDDDDDD